jgi:hypothetical protein
MGAGVAKLSLHRQGAAPVSRVVDAACDDPARNTLYLK